MQDRRGHISQRLTPPQPQRLPQQRRLCLPVPRPGLRPGLLHQQLEAAHVRITGRHHHEVPLSAAVDQPATQQLAQPGHIGLHGPTRLGRQPATIPDRLGQLVHRHQLTGPQQQARQQHPLPHRRHRHHPAIIGDLKQPQQTKLHELSLPIRLASTHQRSLATTPQQRNATQPVPQRASDFLPHRCTSPPGQVRPPRSAPSGLPWGGAALVWGDARLRNLALLVWLYGFYIAPEDVAGPTPPSWGC